MRIRACAVAGWILVFLFANPALAQAPGADLVVSSVRTFGAIQPGSNVRVEALLENRGPSRAESLVLDVEISRDFELTGASISFLTTSGVCTISESATAYSVRCTAERLFVGHWLYAQFHGRPRGPVGSELSFFGTLSSAVADPRPQNNVLAFRRLVQDGSERANLVASVVNPPSETPSGSSPTFRVRAHNAGPSVAGLTNADVIFPRAAAAADIVVPDGWVCAREPFPPIAIAPPTSDAFRCERHRFDPGTVEFLLTVNTSGLTLPYEVGLVLDSDTLDPVDSNNRAMETIQIGAPAAGSIANVPFLSATTLTLLTLLLGSLGMHAMRFRDQGERW